MLKTDHKCFVPIQHYCTTRKNYVRNLVNCALISVIFLVFFMLFDIKEDLDFQSVYSEFINSLVTGISILLSFSIAILTVYITSDNKNIESLKEIKASNSKYKPLKKRKDNKDNIEKIGDIQRLTLYQVILSGVTYNILIEIIFLLFLFLQMSFRTVLNNCTYKYFVCIDIFFVLHIFIVLFENIINMYLSFWRNSKSK